MWILYFFKFFMIANSIFAQRLRFVNVEISSKDLIHVYEKTQNIFSLRLDPMIFPGCIRSAKVLNGLNSTKKVKVSFCEEELKAVIMLQDENQFHLVPDNWNSLKNHFLHFLPLSGINLIKRALRYKRETKNKHILYQYHFQNGFPFCGTKLLARSINIGAQYNCNSPQAEFYFRKKPLKFDLLLGLFYDEYFAARHNNKWPSIQLDLKMIMAGVRNYFEQADFLSEVGHIKIHIVHIGHINVGDLMIGSTLLYKFTQHIRNILLDSKNSFFHVGILISGQNLHEHFNGVKLSILEGIAMQSSLCSFGAALVVRRLNLSVISTLVHELAHVLGAEHDSSSIECACDSNTFIMSNTTGIHKQFFSQCSKLAIKKMLLKAKHQCLVPHENLPPDKLEIKSSEEFAVALTPNAQCSLSMQASFIAEDLKSCRRLTCKNELFSVTSSIPLNGTPCFKKSNLKMRCCFGECMLNCTYVSDFI